MGSLPALTDLKSLEVSPMALTPSEESNNQFDSLLESQAVVRLEWAPRRQIHIKNLLRVQMIGNGEPLKSL